MGLSAVISEEAYEVTAETIGPCLVNFVERDGLLKLIERNGELGLRSAQAVSREFQSLPRYSRARVVQVLVRQACPIAAFMGKPTRHRCRA
jgi:CRP/FNR family transcriptional regulator